MNIWQVLEIEVTNDLKLIKQAYANKIKQHKPEVDPQGFQLLRQAYEIAQKYAQGMDVNIELDETSTSKLTNSFKEDSQEKNKFEDQKSSIDPINAAFYLLDKLEKNEQEAIEILMGYNKEKLLDNIQFSEKFQHVLATNLLSRPIAYLFTYYTFDLFNWYEKINMPSKDMMYNIALKNLYIQLNPYLFFQKIIYLSRIKNKKQALKEKVHWNDCYAARILLNKAKPRLFFIIKHFCNGKKQALISLVNDIKNIYPQTISMGLSISSFAWWCKVKAEKNVQQLFFTIAILFLIFGGYFLKGMNDLPELEKDSLQQKPTIKTVSNKKNKLANTSNSYQTILESNQVDSIDGNLSPHKIFLNGDILMNEPVFMDSNFYLIDDINKNELPPGFSNLDIALILRNKLIQEIDKVNQAGILYSTKSDISLKIQVHYGLMNVNVSARSPKEYKMVPILSVEAIIYADQRLGSKTFQTEPSELPNYNWLDIKKNPQLIDDLWKIATNKIVEEIIDYCMVLHPSDAS